MSDQGPEASTEAATAAGSASTAASSQTAQIASLSAPVQEQSLGASDNCNGGDGSTAEIRAQVEREQALADAQKRLRALEGEVQKAQTEKGSVESERDAAVQATNQLRSQLSALQSSFHKSSAELSVLQTRIEIIEREKKELQDETSRLQDRSSRSNQELYTLRTQKSEAAQKIAHLDVEVSEQRMAAESAKFNEERSKQALDAARAENLRVGKIHADLDERFGKYRAEKASLRPARAPQSQLSVLQTDHDITLSRLTTAESSYQALQRSYNEQANRLASAFADISNLTSTAAARKATSQTEVHRLVDENRLLERRADDARATIEEREAELERLVTAHEVEKKDWEAKWKGEERRRREADKRAEELRAVVDRIALAGGEGTDLSPAAALAGELRGSGKSYTQFFTEYTVQEGKLRSAENEIARLTDLLDEIANDIAEKKPILDEQALEHAAAVDRANALAGELATVMTTRDGFEETVKALKAASAHHTEEVSSLQGVADDLSRQVQHLTRQLAIRDDPSLANVTLDGGAVAEGDVITDHLLEFRSLRGLQENNQKLLKLTRALMAKLDQRESRRATAEEDDIDTGATLDQATETIEKLHKQLLDASRKINEATRERDFFSKLLARGEGLKWASGAAMMGQVGAGAGPLDDEPAPHAQTIELLRGEIEGVRVKAEEEVRELKVQLRSKEEAVGQAEVAKARAEVKATMLEEQTRSLTDANSLQKQRGDGLESQIRQIQASIGTAQNEARTALEQVAVRQAEADRLRMDVAVLRAEKEQWSSTEARLQSDFRSVQSERAKLQQLIENHTQVSAESDRSRAEERGKYERRIEELGRESTALRSQIEQAREGTRAAEAKVSQADAALESAVSTVRAEKDAAETLAASRQTEIDNLQAELTKTRESEATKHRIGLNWKNRHDAAKTDMTALSTSHASAVEAKDKEISEMKQQLETSKKELEETKAKLAEVEGKLANVTRSEQLKEATVQRLQSELAAARQRTGGPASGADQAALAALQAEKGSLQTRVAQLEKDLEAAKRTQSTSAGPSAEGASDNADLQAKHDLLAQQNEDLNKASLHDGRRRKYEEGVLKVNRANTSMRNRIAELNGKIADLEKQISEQAGQTSLEAPGIDGGSGSVDQAKIDEAVQAAVYAREVELNAEHAAALDVAIFKAKASASASADTSGDADADTDAAVKAKEAELEAAASKHKAELEAEQAKLAKQAEELGTKIKALEKQVRTSEISRKTLERQKNDAEAKLKKMQEGDAGAAAPTPAGSSTGTATAGLAPIPVTPTPGSSASGSSAPAQPGSTPVRGAAKAGTGARGPPARGGQGGRPSVLQNVNATLTAAQPTSAPSPPASASAQKRPAPEEGEITESADSTQSQTAAPAAGDGGDILARLKGGDGPRGRVLKRPRGTGPPRGGAGAARGAPAGRRTSAGPAAGTAAATSNADSNAAGGGGATGEGSAGGAGAGASGATGSGGNEASGGSTS